MFRRTTAVAISALMISVGQPVVADGLAGSYLAARQASIASDYKSAARYYALALVQDPLNPNLLESTLAAYIGYGDFDRAGVIARTMQEAQIPSQIADMILLSGQFGAQEYDTIIQEFQAGKSISPLVDGLVQAWAQAGAGRMSDALTAFDAVVATPGIEGFGMLHKAFALAMVGDYQGADNILSGASGNPVPATRSGIIAHAEILSQLDRNDAAIELFEKTYGGRFDPEIDRRLTVLKDGQKLPFTLISDARAGLAEVFFNVAGMLQSEDAPAYSLLYTRIAESLRSDNVEILLLCALLLEDLQRYELATAVYDKVPQSDPSYYIAEMGRADALYASDKPDAAIEVLRRLSKTHANLSVVHNALGDTLRREEQFTEATRAYSRAIELYSETAQPQWAAFYARAITHERVGNWEKAEADFRHALSLSPDQPYVLNYLGYSLVERQEKLDEALSMIEKAVAAQPENGFVTDSLGWVFYRLGRYDDAVKYMTRAAELEPVDPVISDHLGDTLWAVGRHREAEFQWSRALSFVKDDTPDADPDRMRRKLEVGLDQVLAEEGAAPLKVANGN